MKNLYFFAAYTLLLFLAPGIASASETINFQGTQITCDNSCSIFTNSNGTQGVRDCCGGRIHIHLPPRPPVTQ